MAEQKIAIPPAPPAASRSKSFPSFENHGGYCYTHQRKDHCVNDPKHYDGLGEAAKDNKAGSRVGVYCGPHSPYADKCNADNPWVVVCHEHGTTRAFPSWNTAKKFAAHMHEEHGCPGCIKRFENPTAKEPAK